MKAFTIVEIIVVMLITAIVVSASMMLYSSINEIQQNSFNKGEKEAEFVLLTNVLRNDCNEAKIIQYKNEEIYCVKRKEIVVYELTTDKIIRKGIVTDTFPFMHYDIQITYADSAHQAVNIISLSLSLKKDSVPFYYFKQYGSQLLWETENLK